MIASHNAGKILEISDLLHRIGLVADAEAAGRLTSPEERSDRYELNAASKAIATAAALSQVAIADDSGVEIDALNGFPGVRTARWATEVGGFGEAMKIVHERLEFSNGVRRDATMVCVLCVAGPDGTSRTFRGDLRGEFVWPPRGGSAIGFEPCFVPRGKTLALSELSFEVKQYRNARALAFDQLSNELRGRSFIDTHDL
ncbi:MAG: non-canonical purine NTP pyrophosphatase [Polyangiales bacterium]